MRDDRGPAGALLTFEVTGTMDVGTTGVRPATSDDVKACAQVLTQAFADDPGTRNFEPDDERRRGILPAFFRAFVAASLSEGGDLVVAGDPVEGIASWFGPEHHGPSPEAMGANGFGEFLGQAGPVATERLFAMLAEIEQQHERLVQGPHLRLEFFGVVPSRQGSGIGTALIEHGHRRADELRLPCYLETMTEKNVRYYERRGYGVAGHFTIGEGTPAWGMLRSAGG
jgi:GNAT superfamily N-acetyltransferase